jgi:8-hydroxy-5-deazaflavin:NADPH oxidoreductase
LYDAIHSFVVVEGDMKIGILGTGIVGQTLSAKLASLGHEVMLGTRDVAQLMARPAGGMGELPFAAWHQQNAGVKLGTFAQAAAHGEVLFNCTNGSVSLQALKLAGEANLNGKILVDVSNPLDFSRGFPPSLTVCNTDSLAEQIQRAFPRVKVVKSLNTMTASVMVNPSLVPGDHDAFVCGDDTGAKAAVAGMLKDWFGWKSVVDLGDITAARGAEMILPIWLRLMGVMQTPMFNFKIVH